MHSINGTLLNFNRPLHFTVKTISMFLDSKRREERIDFTMMYNFCVRNFEEN